MKKLSEKEAEFIKLRYYDELTQVQIAKEMEHISDVCIKIGEKDFEKAEDVVV